MALKFRFTCKSSTERPGPVWDVALFPVTDPAYVANLLPAAIVPGGQIQLAGLKAKLFEPGNVYVVTFEEDE